MSVARRRMLLHGKRGWSDSFLGGSLGGRWTTDHGMPAVSGGALAGSALAADGYELISNKEFTANISGWANAAAVTISWVDSSVTPGTSSPGADLGCLKARFEGGANPMVFPSPMIAVILGCIYSASCYGYAPSSNTEVNAAQFQGASPSVSVNVTAEDMWQALSIEWGPVEAVTQFPRLRPLPVTGATAGDEAYFDTVSAQRKSVLTYAPAWPNCRIRTIVTTPASGVCPLHIVFRLNDGLTYSMLRLTPATAGNDTAIIERVAGVETTRAAADMDFAAATEYQVRIDVRGSQINAYINDVLATSYASAVGQSYRNVGIELLDTAGWSVSEFRVEEL